MHIFTIGEVPSGGGDGTTSEGSMDYDDRNGDESDEEGRNSHSPDTDESTIVTPSNFDTHMAAQTTHSNIPVQRLVQSVKQVGRKSLNMLNTNANWMVADQAGGHQDNQGGLDGPLHKQGQHEEAPLLETRL